MTLQGRGRGGVGVTNECSLGVTEKMSLQLCIISWFFRSDFRTEEVDRIKL